MKHYKIKFASCSEIIRLGVILITLSNLSWSSVPKIIRILGIFNDPKYGGDPIHEIGFLAAIDTINQNRDVNQDGHITLRGTTIEPEILHIPPGARYIQCNTVIQNTV
jgi:hypothetical protein